MAQGEVAELLERLDDASTRSDWPEVKTLAARVLRADPDNEDAPALLRLAERRLHARGRTEAEQGRLPESFVGGRYRVQRLLGEGARKRVYLARGHDA